MWVSRDAGASWSHAWEGKDASALARAPDGSLVFGTLGSGVGSCDRDGGRCSLLAAFPGGRTIVGLAAVAAPEPAVLIASSGDVYRMTDGTRFSKIDLGIEAPFPVAVYADAGLVAVSLEGIGLRFQERARPGAWKRVAFPKRITAIARHGGRILFGTDGLGVFVVRGSGAQAANAGLLNFPDAVVEEVLKGTRTTP